MFRYALIKVTSLFRPGRQHRHRCAGSVLLTLLVLHPDLAFYQMGLVVNILLGDFALTPPGIAVDRLIEGFHLSGVIHAAVAARQLFKFPALADPVGHQVHQPCPLEQAVYDGLAHAQVLGEILLVMKRIKVTRCPGVLARASW